MLTGSQVKDSALRISAPVHVQAYPVQNAPGCLIFSRIGVHTGPRISPPAGASWPLLRMIFSARSRIRAEAFAGPLLIARARAAAAASYG